MSISESGQIQSFQSLMIEYSKLDVASFQRNYAWDSENIEDLYQDLRSNSSTFIGCFIFQSTGTDPEDSKKRIGEVVDGQQRITTLFMLLAAIRDAVKKLPETTQQIPKTKTSFAVRPAEEIEEFLFNGAPDRPRFRANPLVSNLFVKNMIADPHGRPKVPKRASDGRASLPLRSAHFKIISLIENDLKSVSGGHAGHDQLLWLEELRKAIMGLQCLRISSDNPHDALEVFLSLNSKGKPLSRADVIRGILLKKRCDVISGAAQVLEIHAKMHGDWTELVNTFQSDDLDEGFIEQFVRYFLLATGRAKVQKKSAPSIVEDRVNYIDLDPEQKRSPMQCAVEAERLWDELVSYSDVYVAIMNPKFGEQRTNYYLTLLRAVSDNYRVLLMNVLARNGGEAISELDEISRLTLALTLRHYLSGGNAQNLESTFQKISNDYREFGDAAATINSLRHEITLVKLNSEEIFRSGVSGLAKPILQFIEWNLAVKQGLSASNWPKWDSSGVHLEHIAPETPTKEWLKVLTGKQISEDEYEEIVEQLGNKTLLDAKINKSIKQSDFMRKKTHYVTLKGGVKYSYEKCGVQSTKDLAKLDTWTKREIELRDRWLSEMFESVTSVDFDPKRLTWFSDWCTLLPTE